MWLLTIQPIDRIPTWAWIVFLTVMGAWIGSYLNLVIYRVPRGQQTVSGPSYCTTCNHKLTFLDLIPILSYIFLRGKCRHCGDAISPRYLIVELLSALSYVILYLVIGRHLLLVPYLVFASTLIVLSYIDARTRLLPSKVIYWGGGISAGSLLGVLLLNAQYTALLRAAIGAAVFGAFMFIIWFAFPKAMGFGDVRLSFFIGAMTGVFGIMALLLAMAASFCSQSILGSIWGVAHHKNLRKLYIPLGPFLAIGTLCGVVWGPALVNFIH